jgi:aspartyl-tRNA(Asn)/glutamyl-tRNA(Gln) amidotransferase subunit C
MSKVNVGITEKIASLAKLKLAEGEREKYTGELEKILAYVELLNEVDTKNVEPLVHGIPLPTHYREDVAVSLSPEDTQAILQCAEQSLYDQYKVPQVIGGEA